MTTKHYIFGPLGCDRPLFVKTLPKPLLKLPGELLPPKRPIQNRRIWLTIGLIAIILLVLAYFVEWDEVLFILQHTQWEIILLAGVFLLVGIVLISVRWRFVLDNIPTFFEAFHVDSIG